jgi:hypothetical protein
MLPLAAILAAVALLALTGPSEAQILYGSVVGNVTDTSQAGVPGATVTLINTDTNLAREATTSADGTYRFVNVQPGAYRVRVVLAGFKEYVRDSVPVASSTVTRIDVALEVGAISENVTVQSEVSLLQTDTGDVRPAEEPRRSKASRSETTGTTRACSTSCPGRPRPASRTRSPTRPREP